MALEGEKMKLVAAVVVVIAVIALVFAYANGNNEAPSGAVGQAYEAGNSTPTPTPTTGSIQASTYPQGATIRLDGLKKGITPRTITGVNPGTHTIEFVKTQYVTHSQPVIVTSGQTTYVSVNLTHVNQTGKIYATSTPRRARVYVDGISKGLTPITIQYLMPGIHSVKFTYSGYPDYLTTATVYAMQTTNVYANMSSPNPSPSPSPIPSPSPSPSPSPTPIPNNCSDTDGGFNVNLMGTAYGYQGGAPYSYTDNCHSTSLLDEYYCAGSSLYNTTYNCNANGTATCISGRCVPNPSPSPIPSPSPSPMPNSCNDSDGGFYLFTQGTASGIFGNAPYSYTDFCPDNATLLEYYCGGTLAYNYTTSCMVNTSTACIDGRCV